jgi:hypothetical protein
LGGVIGGILYYICKIVKGGKRVDKGKYDG